MGFRKRTIKTFKSFVFAGLNVASLGSEATNDYADDTRKINKSLRPFRLMMREMEELIEMREEIEDNDVLTTSMKTKMLEKVDLKIQLLEEEWAEAESEAE